MRTKYRITDRTTWESWTVYLTAEEADAYRLAGYIVGVAT